jgi:hypothetical protein
VLAFVGSVIVWALFQARVTTMPIVRSDPEYQSYRNEMTGNNLDVVLHAHDDTTTKLATTTTSVAVHASPTIDLSRAMGELKQIHALNESSATEVMKVVPVRLPVDKAGDYMICVYYVLTFSC